MKTTGVASPASHMQLQHSMSLAKSNLFMKSQEKVLAQLSVIKNKQTGMEGNKKKSKNRQTRKRKCCEGIISSIHCFFPCFFFDFIKFMRFYLMLRGCQIIEFRKKLENQKHNLRHITCIAETYLIYLLNLGLKTHLFEFLQSKCIDVVEIKYNNFWICIWESTGSWNSGYLNNAYSLKIMLLAKKKEYFWNLSAP